MSKHWPGIVLLSLALMLPACAQKNPHGPRAASISSSPGDLGYTGPEINWAKPEVAVVVSDAAEAQHLLSFTPIEPRLPNLKQTYVSDPEDVALDERGIFFIFEESTGGTYWVIESPSELTEEDMQSEVKLCEEPGKCVGNWSIVKVRDSNTALLIEKGTQSTAIIWVEDGLTFQVMGPSETFSGEEALAAANDL